MPRTKFTDIPKNDPVRIEQVFAERPGGVLVVDAGFDVFATTAVGKDANGKYAVIKCCRVVEDAAADATTIKVAKGSGVAKNDFLAVGKKSVKATNVVTSNADYDVVTISMGVAITAGTTLYQAAAASADAAEPIYTPEGVIGNDMPTGISAELPMRFIVGAVLRKETACISPECAAIIGTIKLV